MPPKPVKFAIIADAHLGSAQQKKPPMRFPERARSLLRYVVSQLNADHKPEFVVQVGGVIEAEDADEDEDNLSTAVEILRELQMPVYHAIGNDEQVNVSIQKICAAFKITRPFQSFRCAPFLGITLFADKNGDDWTIGKDQMKWLEQELRGDDKHVLVFSYFPLVDVEIDEAASESESESAENLPVELANRADVRNLLAQSGKVRAVFSGHWHKNSLVEQGGIHYVSIQSLVQNVAGNRPSESFAVAKFFEDSAVIEVVGMDPMEFRI
jgi:hypothetical protein